MLRVAERSEPETLRLFRPGAIVAFGAQDRRAPGYARAVSAARAHGFAAINRMVGGTAAVFHKGTVAFTWTIPDRNPRENIDARFRRRPRSSRRRFPGWAWTPALARCPANTARALTA